MEATLGLLGGDFMSSKESSYQNEAEIELGLGLSLCSGGGGVVVKAKESTRGDFVKIMTAKDFPSGFSSKGSATSGVSGTKRGADCVGYSASPSASPIVGWPPIRSYRMNSLVTQVKSANGEEDKGVGGIDISKDASKKKTNHGSNNMNDITFKERGHIGFVKVNMDGLPIGRKVDLSAHSCYETLARALEEMFSKPSTTISSTRPDGVKKQTIQSSKLLDGSSEFVLTYEDKEGDWMLIGDVPWGMFLSTVKRLRIMKTSEANGLDPRFRNRPEIQKSKLI